MEYHIGPAQAKQLEAVARLYVDSWQRTYRGLLPDAQLDTMTVQGCREKWERYLTAPGHSLLCAADRGGLLGFAACRPCTSPPGCLLLDSLHVDPAAQGRGVGSALIALCGRLAREAGWPGMAVYVVKGNHRAQALYEHLGARLLFSFDDPADGAPSRALMWDDLSVF